LGNKPSRRIHKRPEIELTTHFDEPTIPETSAFGSICEGYVVRNKESFPENEFNQNVAKCVRLGHVQTDEHWTKNWVKAEFLEDPIARMLVRAEGI